MRFRIILFVYIAAFPYVSTNTIVRFFCFGHQIFVIYSYVQVEDPLSEALKYLRLLQEHSADALETHLLAFEVYFRTNKKLLALQVLQLSYSYSPKKWCWLVINNRSKLGILSYYIIAFDIVKLSLTLSRISVPNGRLLCAVGPQAVKKQLALDPNSPDVHLCLVSWFSSILSFICIRNVGFSVRVLRFRGIGYILIFMEAFLPFRQSSWCLSSHWFLMSIFIDNGILLWFFIPDTLVWVIGQATKPRYTCWEDYSWRYCIGERVTEVSFLVVSCVCDYEEYFLIFTVVISYHCVHRIWLDNQSVLLQTSGCVFRRWC